MRERVPLAKGLSICNVIFSVDCRRRVNKRKDSRSGLGGRFRQNHLSSYNG